MTGRHCGTSTGYREHMRDRTDSCQPCRDAVAVKERKYRANLYLAGGPLLIDATGTRRRLQALAALGWTFGDIAQRLGGSTPTAVGYMTKRPQVRRSTAARVAAVFEALCMTPGPSVRTRCRAERAGWPPPLAWGDDIDDPAAVSSTEVEAAHTEALAENRRREWRRENHTRRARHRQEAA